ncbi:MAG: trigger factor [Gammaproteobacteria bacterium]|nr:trigger factor [Gammaproteobacteria bacterium]
MQVSLETTGKLGRRMTVEVPGETIRSELEKKLQGMSRQVKIPGFRPGKVPLKVVRQRFGQQARDEVLADTMHSSYREAIDQEKLRPAGPPQIEPVNLEDGQDLKFIATFEVFPDIELADAGTFEITVAQAEVTSGDIDDMIGKLRRQRMQWQEIDRAAGQEDRVTLDFKGTLDGEAFPGGSQDDYVAVMGHSGLLPEFERELEGMCKGDAKSFPLRFPKEYHQPELAEKTAVFEVNVKKVEAGELPEAGEEFVRELGIQDGNLDTLREQLERNLKGELEQRKKAFDKSQVMKCLFESNEFELPASLLEQEVQAVRDQFMQTMQIKEESKLPQDMLEEQAKRRTALGLIIGEIIRQNEIQLDPARVSRELNAIASSYANPEEIVQYYRGNVQAMAGIESKVMEDQVVEWVLERARQVPRAFTFDEMVNDQM